MLGSAFGFVSVQRRPGLQVESLYTFMPPPPAYILAKEPVDFTKGSLARSNKMLSIMCSATVKIVELQRYIGEAKNEPLPGAAKR